MSDEIDEPDGFLVARVEITRVLMRDDVMDHVIAVDARGDQLGLTEALGMLRLAEDSLIREAMGEA